MKAIHMTGGIIEGVRSRKDKSLGLSLSTPELTPEQMTLFLSLQGLNCDWVITPSDIEDEIETEQVDGDLNQKSQSQRMRAVLFILWKQDPKGLEFAEFYKSKMEKLIEWLKQSIEG